MKKLSKINDIVKKYNLSAKKSLGQNYIFDLNLTEKIVQSCGDLENFNVLEIGPGPGSLTRSILNSKAKKVTVIEIDERFLKPLEDIKRYYPERLQIIIEDFFKIDLVEQVKPPLKIISNLPYNRSVDILSTFLESESWPPYWTNLTFMFQKEVADRILAKENTKNYGRLSVLSNWRTKTKKVFDIEPFSFKPKPKITSTLVHFEPMNFFFEVENKNKFLNLIKVTFNQRRKMVRKILKPFHIDIEKILIECDIKPTDRAENISIEKFCKLSNILFKKD